MGCRDSEVTNTRAEAEPHGQAMASDLGPLLKTFFEAHDPTQGMRQQNDIGTQYRSGIYVTPDQAETAKRVADEYSKALEARGLDPVTTEIKPVGPFYYAEDYHQQYLHKVPNGYCGLKGTGVSCAISYNRA